MLPTRTYLTIQRLNPRERGNTLKSSPLHPIAKVLQVTHPKPPAWLWLITFAQNIVFLLTSPKSVLLFLATYIY